MSKRKFFSKPKEFSGIWISTDNGKFMQKLDEITEKYNKSKISRAIAKLLMKFNPTLAALKMLVKFEGKEAVLMASTKEELENKIKVVEHEFNYIINNLIKHYQKYRS